MAENSRATGGLLSRISRPTLLLDRARAEKNIARMVTRAAASGARLRPHFKTHQSHEVGRWFREAGVSAITVSSVEMAEYFAADGWQDITVAFPANVRQSEQLDALAARLRLNLLVESPQVVRLLAERLHHDTGIWIKIDSGYGRTGIPWREQGAVVALAQQIRETPGIHLEGLLVHAGHSYRARGEDEIRAVYRETVDRLISLRGALAAAGVENIALSLGDTPCCSVVERFDDVEEIRPGNFIFYDLVQVEIGSCREEDIAVAVACPVVAVHPARNQFVLYGGAVHLSKEFLTGEGGRPSFGKVAFLDEGGWGPSLPGASVDALSQEHGLVTAPAEIVSQVQPGDLVAVLPVHSCLTVNLLRQYLTLDGSRIDAAPLP